MVTIEIVEGDITRVDADAIIAPINSEGLWNGGIDRAIQSVSGDQFHVQAAVVLKSKGLSDLDTVIAKRSKIPTKDESFDDVIFVIDDVESPLETVVETALKAAEKGGYGSVSIPAIRTGIMADLEKNAAKGISDGIKQFSKTAKTVSKITVVVYKNKAFFEKINGYLKKACIR